MKQFLSQDFLLSNKYAEELYFNHAAKMPIIDYHNHLPVADIANNRSFDNIGEASLEGDHYKWRALRSNGVSEHLITGDASYQDKWQAWAETIPYTVRNPLYHWQHLELQRYFDIHDTLDGVNAQDIFTKTQAILQKDTHSCVGLLKMQNVEALCTTDDPLDDLRYHQACKDLSIKVLPTFRPDNAINFDDLQSWNLWIDRLSSLTGDIKTLDDLLSSLEKRHDYFHENGCRLSDHGLSKIPFVKQDKQSLETSFSQARSNKVLSLEQKNALICYLMSNFAIFNAKRDWTMQLHLGPMRNNNSKMLQKIGRDSGFDSIGENNIAYDLSQFLDSLNVNDNLPKTILYNLNPTHNSILATMCGNFQDDSIAGKMQFGSAWWFLDQLDGMKDQINTLSTLGLISRFVGMLTDSRSFLSFPRHEYFRRLLCDIFGQDIHQGKIPNDMQFIGKVIEDICYYNAKRYFKF